MKDFACSGIIFKREIRKDKDVNHTGMMMMTLIKRYAGRARYERAQRRSNYREHVFAHSKHEIKKNLHERLAKVASTEARTPLYQHINPTSQAAKGY